MTLTLLILIALALIVFSLLGIAVLMAAFTTGVPFVPTKQNVIQVMLKLGNPQPTETVYDLGSGNGEVLFAFPKECKRIGYEQTPLLHLWARLRNTFKKETVTFHKADLFTASYADADVITCYLFPQVMERFEREIWPHLKPGCRVVSNAFKLPTIPSQEEVRAGKSTIFLYVR